jgi:MarR family transcriptional regulator for hemolysin
LLNDAKKNAAHKTRPSAIKDRSRPAKPGTSADLEARQAIRLSFLIHDVSRMRRTAFDQLMKPLGVTRAQWWVLAHLSRHDGMMQTQLAETLDVGKASLGTLIERLSASGLVERRDDLVDKRAKRVFMAKAGHQLLKRMTQEELRFNERILEGVLSAERAAMIRILAKMKSALSKQVGSSVVDED